jgi:hypothetical protein
VHPITRSVLITPVSGSTDRSVILFCAKVSVAYAKKAGKGECGAAMKSDQERGGWGKGCVVRGEETYSTERTCAECGFGYFLQMPMLTNDHGCLYRVGAHLVSNGTHQI